MLQVFLKPYRNIFTLATCYESQVFEMIIVMAIVFFQSFGAFRRSITTFLALVLIDSGL